MTPLAKTLFGAGTASMIAVTAPMVSPNPDHGIRAPRVTIANTPLPVAGTLQTTVLNTVDARVVGNVGITGSVPVTNAAGGPLLVQVVDPQAADEPFQTLLCHQSGDLGTPRCPASSGVASRFRPPPPPGSP